MDMIDTVFSMGDINTLAAINGALGWGYYAIKILIYMCILAYPAYLYIQMLRFPYLVNIFISGPLRTVSAGRDRGRIYKNKDGSMYFKLYKRNFNMPFIPEQAQIMPCSGLKIAKGVINVYQMGTSEFSFIPMATQLHTEIHGKDKKEIIDFAALEANMGMIAVACSTAEHRFSNQPSTMQQLMPIITMVLPIAALVIVLLVFSEKFSQAAGALASAIETMKPLLEQAMHNTATAAPAVIQTAPQWVG